MKVSKETKIKVLVNLKCLGYMGKCVKHFPQRVRGQILDELTSEGYLDEDANPTEKAQPIIIANLGLCECL